MATFVLNDRVEVRNSGSQAWRPGTVTNDSALPGGGAWEVTLDNPVNANAWGGRTRKYAGANFLTIVYIYKNVEAVQPGEFIKAEGT